MCTSSVVILKVETQTSRIRSQLSTLSCWNPALFVLQPPETGKSCSKAQLKPLQPLNVRQCQRYPRRLSPITRQHSNNPQEASWSTISRILCQMIPINSSSSLLPPPPNKYMKIYYRKIILKNNVELKQVWV